jgi:hypothetical protein
LRTRPFGYQQPQTHAEETPHFPLHLTTTLPGKNKTTHKNSSFITSENLLRRIISVSNISFTFDFFFAEFVDVLNPVMGIDIVVDKLESEMNGPNMWHFVYVLKSILFDRGQKAEEILLVEVSKRETPHIVTLALHLTA